MTYIWAEAKITILRVTRGMIEVLGVISVGLFYCNFNRFLAFDSCKWPSLLFMSLYFVCSTVFAYLGLE